MADIRSRPGVVDVVMLPTAVAVVAQRFWQARAALAAADIDFDAGPHAAMNSARLKTLYRDKLAQGPFKTVKDEGDGGAAPAGSLAEATYELGFQAHATLEPMNALAHVTAACVDIWAPTQSQGLARYAVAAALAVEPDRVQVYRSPFLGGGFGRRLLANFAIDAALLSRAVARPVKVIWSREDDFRRDFYRPATPHRMQARVDRGAGFSVRLLPVRHADGGGSVVAREATPHRR